MKIFMTEVGQKCKRDLKREGQERKMTKGLTGRRRVILSCWRSEGVPELGPLVHCAGHC